MNQILQTSAAIVIVAVAALWWLRHTFGRKGGSCGGCSAGNSAHRLANRKQHRS